MRFSHILLALLTVTIWGFNFVVIKIGLQGMPPLFFTTMRFTFAAFPLVFFVPRPTVPWKFLVGWGLAQFAVQFGLLFVGMKLGMSAGLSSLVIQLQAFFTIGLAWWLLKEQARFAQLLGAGIALAGMAIVAWHLDTPSTFIGLLLVVGAACSWAVANLLVKRMKVVNPMSLVVWGSLIAAPILGVISAVVEGPQSMWSSLLGMNLISWITVLFQSYPNTLLGFGIWSMLMRRYPASQVAPFALLVPVVGMVSGALVLHESMEPWKIIAGVLVLTGLALNQFAARLRGWMERALTRP